MVVHEDQREGAKEEVQDAEDEGRINVQDQAHGLEDQ